MKTEYEPSKYSQRFFRHLAVNLVVSIVISWLWFPLAVSLFDFRWYGASATVSAGGLNDLWACQAITGIEAVLISAVFHVNRKELWPWFLGATGAFWGSQALFLFLFSPEAKRLTYALLVFAVPSTQLLIASIQVGSWRAWVAWCKEP